MSPAPLRAISSMATRHLLPHLAEAAVAAGLPFVEITSVGGVDAARRVAAGEPYDLVVLAQDALETLGEDGHIAPELIRPLVTSQVAVGVRDEAHDRPQAARPGDAAFPDAAGLRSALRAAGRIGYSTGPSGTALLELIEKLGIGEEVGGRLVQARPGLPVAALLARGEVEIGFQQLSELTGEPGVRLLGVLPPDCAIDTTFAASVATAAGDPDAARSVLELWASGSVASIKLSHGFDAPGDTDEG